MDSSSLLALSNLLKPPEEDKDSEDELETSGPSPYANPGSIGASVQATPTENNSSISPAVSKDIWESQDVAEQQHYEYDDPRPEPEYEMIFKQAVGAEDIFLGMGNKNPTTASCEDLVVRIKLPAVNAKDIELDITEVFLDCRTSKWRLGLHLPHKVDSSKSKVKWISDKDTLEVTLRITREYDPLNQ